MITENGNSIAKATQQVNIPNSTFKQLINIIRKPSIVIVESLSDLPDATDENQRLCKEILRLQDEN